MLVEKEKYEKLFYKGASQLKWNIWEFYNCLEKEESCW